MSPLEPASARVTCHTALIKHSSSGLSHTPNTANPGRAPLHTRTTPFTQQHLHLDRAQTAGLQHAPMTAHQQQQYASQEELHTYSSNSLDIRNGFAARERGTPSAEPARPLHKQPSPTAVGELLALLDDQGTLAAAATPPHLDSRGFLTGEQMNEPAGELISEPGHALTGLPIEQISSSRPGPHAGPRTSLPTQVHTAEHERPSSGSRSRSSASARDSATILFDEALAALSPPEELQHLHTPQHLQPEQPCIDPNLLSNSNSYVDSGLQLDDSNVLEAFADQDESHSVLDEFTFSRRPSEPASRAFAPDLPARGSISYATDFWNLPSSGSKSGSERPAERLAGDSRLPASSGFRPAHKPHRSFAGVLPSSLGAARPPSVGVRSESLKPSGTSTSPFKIENELTQLLSDYNLSYSHQKATKFRTGSFNALTISRKSSLSEPQHRVQKQRASTSLVDGNNHDLISKLYGDMATPRPRLTNLSWENAIMSDDEEDEEDELAQPLKALGNSHADGAAGYNFNSNDILQQLESEAEPSNSKFIPPNLLVNDSNQAADNNAIDMTNLSSGSAGSNTLNPLQLSLTASTSPSSYNSNSNAKQRKATSFSKPSRNSKSSSPIEEDEKPFKCQECTKAFRRSEHLKRHIRSVHSTERPFHCSYCDKKFSRSDNLSQHLKTHKKHGDF